MVTIEYKETPEEFKDHTTGVVVRVKEAERIEYIEKSEDGIYSSVPLELEDAEDKKAEEVRDFLFSCKGEWRTAKEIADICDLPKSNTQVKVRKVIRRLIRRGVPVVAGANGFMYATHPNQIRVYKEKLQVRVQGIEGRIKDLSDIEEDMRRRLENE